MEKVVKIYNAFSIGGTTSNNADQSSRFTHEDTRVYFVQSVSGVNNNPNDIQSLQYSPALT